MLELPHPNRWPFILGIEKGFQDSFDEHLLARMGNDAWKYDKQEHTAADTH